MLKCKEYSVTKDQVTYMHDKVRFFKNLQNVINPGLLEFFILDCLLDFFQIGLHSLSNPSASEFAVSLHLYCPPFRQCQVFKEADGQKEIRSMSFHSVCGIPLTQAPLKTAGQHFKNN